MKYAYSALEAAALWVGIDPAEIRGRMELADLARLEEDHAEAIAYAAAQDAEEIEARLARWNFCDFQCNKESTCPDWQRVETEDGDVRRVLKCPQGFRVKPAEELVEPRIVIMPKLSVRELPYPGEFADLPRFEERLAWLEQALSTGDLPGAVDSVLARDLREWMGANFPGDSPNFLWRASEEPLLSSTSHCDHEELSPRVALNVGKSQRGPRRTKQLAMIVDVVKELGYKPLRIPPNGKGEIHRRCVAKDAHLFTPNPETFNGIWQDAIEDDLVLVEGHETFSSGSREK